jgi:hypothetical protein
LTKVAYNRGKILSEARESEEVTYTVIGETDTCDEAFLFVDIQVMLDPHVMSRARTGIPVTVQRRFDVYKDVAEELGQKC